MSALKDAATKNIPVARPAPPTMLPRDEVPVAAATPQASTAANTSIETLEKDMRRAIANRRVSYKRPATALEDDDVGNVPPTSTRPEVPEDRRPVHYLGVRLYDDGRRLRLYRKDNGQREKNKENKQDHRQGTYMKSFNYKEGHRGHAFSRAFDAIELDSKKS